MMINIEDSYILGETGAQVDKVTGLFTKDEDTTSGEKAFAQLNIGTAGSNRNLIDNGWFTVNQRSAGSTSDGYPADRWLKVGNTAATATATADGLVIALNGSSYCDLRNRYSEAEIITPNLGKTATISAMLADGTVFSDQIVLNTTQQNRYLNSGKIRFDLSVSGGVYLVRLVLYDDMTIRAVKLELGSVSTLANDAPPDYETELDHCRKYFYRIKAETSFGTFGNGFCSGDNAAYVLVPINMRKTPTSGSTSGAFRLMVGAGVTTGVTVTYSGNSNSHMARFDVSQSGSSWTAGGSCILSAHSDTNAYIDLNADL